jgi:two-component system chemotaxis response regulator CheB
MNSKNGLQKNKTFPIIVIGASAGGLYAVSELFKCIDSKINAAYLIVLHLAKDANTKVLIKRIQENTKYKCMVVQDNMELAPMNVYLAPQGFHTIVSKNKIILGQGPPENKWRPSINALFRSAAASHNGRVTGIILSGMLDDGSDGMATIKKCGGSTIVQSPETAEFPSMPTQVMKHISVDYILPLEDIGNAIKEISSKRRPKKKIPEAIKLEAEISEKALISTENLEVIGNSSHFTCPDCGGVLWQIKDSKVKRYRCYTGHAYSETDLLLRMEEGIEHTLWTSLRALEEKRNLYSKMVEDSKNYKSGISENYRLKIRDIEKHIINLKASLITFHKKTGHFK